ncbi:radical SAM protein [Phaeobacter inhibens]|uniref:radical SAM protein n=1 Tax=Phaeobacter inhibens TaxID=221822 RepID=UPI00295F467D|nr:radical SAM protein [Phaeobacter inhibens]
MLHTHPHFVKHQPHMLWLELTNFCNLECKHCYNSSGPNHSLDSSISKSQYLEILLQAKSLGFESVQFIGGEPIFYPHLQDLVDRAIDCKFSFIEIYSNLTTIPKWLLEAKYGEVRLATSIYSYIPDTHDEICERRGSFLRTITSVKKAVAQGMGIRASFVELEANVGQYEKTVAFLSDIGVRSVGFDRVREYGRAQLVEEPSIDALCGECPNGNLSIDCNGKVSACIMSKPWSFGDILMDSLSDIFFSDGRQKFIEQVKSNPVTCCHPTSCHPNSCTPNSCQPVTCRPTCSPR